MGLTLRQSFSVRLSALLRDQMSDAEIMNLTIDCEQEVDGRALKCHPVVLVFPGWEVSPVRAA